MHVKDQNLEIVLILTFGFAFASLLGYLAQRIHLSPILGYLLAGYFIGPYSPGFVADTRIAEQLAEIGVILMMFGVGLHFKWEYLLKVKNIAILGAVSQTLIATVLGTAFIYSIGWPLEAGIIIGLSIAVASTVVLVKVLSDNHLLNTFEGHIAVGWLIIEDIFTVIALLAIPVLANAFKGHELSFQNLALSVSFMLFKFLLLVALMFTLGKKLIAYLLVKIARTRSHELLTLTVLALIFVIATTSALVFGASLALGAFIAGMVIGQTHVHQQVSTNALPLKDTFAVVFFLSVGMLFNPQAIIQYPTLFMGILGIILVIKPLTAFLLVLLLRYPLKAALTVGFALAQIGEFSFILSEEAMNLKMLPDEGYDILVACALVSISVNPLFFKLKDKLLHLHKKMTSAPPAAQPESQEQTFPKAVIVGFGPIGQGVAHTVEQLGFKTMIVDLNIDTVAKLIEEGRQAIYGDASHRPILESAQLALASLLVITTPDAETNYAIVKIARQINATLPILARIRYESDQYLLRDVKVQLICCEKEAMKAFDEAIVKLNFKWS